MLNVSIIGHGYWGAKLARNFQNSSYFDILSISDIKKINLINAKKNLPLAKCYSNYKKAIKNDLLDDGVWSWFGGNEPIDQGVNQLDFTNFKSEVHGKIKLAALISTHNNGERKNV